MFAARGEPLALLFILRANRCALLRLSFPLGTRRQEQDPLSLPNTCTKSHGRAAQVLQTCILPSSRCVLGVKRCFFYVHWISPPQGPAGSAPLGFVLALLVLGSGVDAAGQAWEGTCPRSRIVTQLLPALPRSTAALSYKILCCSNTPLKKKNQQTHKPCMHAAALRVMTAGLWICSGITLNYYLH